MEVRQGWLLCSEGRDWNGLDWRELGLERSQSGEIGIGALRIRRFGIRRCHAIHDRRENRKCLHSRD